MRNCASPHTRKFLSCAALKICLYSLCWIEAQAPLSSRMWMRLHAVIILVGSCTVSNCTLLPGVTHLQREDRGPRQQEELIAEEASAAAAAEELIADEAREAAQAAARKAKKKKAKARKQQARSNATSASTSEASAGARLQAQQDLGSMAKLEQSSPSGTRGCEMPPDQDASGLQMQLQHMTVLDCAMPTTHEPAAEDEQALVSASTVVCESAGSAMVHGNPPGGNATFLDQLFCCPITKVHAPSFLYLNPPSLCLPTLCPSFPGFPSWAFPRPCLALPCLALPCLASQQSVCSQA